MSDDETRAGQARNPQVVLDEVMNPCIGKSEHAWVASREIERLRAEVDKRDEVIKTQLTVLEQQDAELQKQDRRIAELEDAIRIHRARVMKTFPDTYGSTMEQGHADAALWRTLEEVGGGG